MRVRTRNRNRRSTGTALALACACVLTLWSGCGARRAPTARSNVLLITVDTLRPDALGWVGGRNQTPSLDRLAAEGFRFPAAVSPVPLTLPAHASLLTGRIPPRHGVRDNGQTLGSEWPTLAERLREAGYATAAFVSGYPLAAAFGLDRGFERYDDRMPHGQEGWVERLAPETTDAALEWITAQAGPWFVWVHYYDPHDPYQPPRTYWRPGDRGAYDGEVEFTDHAIGRLLAGIPAAARAELLTVFTADHGEALGEHGERRHGYFVYESTVAVPLVFHQPGYVPVGQSGAPVRLVDIAPTILDLLGVAALDGTDGVSLRATLDGRAQSLPAAYIESQLPWRYFGWAPLSAIREGDWKYIAAPRAELYRLSDDPQERDNRVAREPGRELALRAELRALESETADSGAAVEDPEALARLRALGYVGAGAAPSAPAGGLADPKVRAGDFAAALERFAEVLAVEPDNPAAVLRSGVALLKQGEPERAIPRLRQATRLDPDRAETRFALGDALIRTGRPAEAIEQWLELVRLQPRRVEGWANLGTTLLATGRPADAAEAFATAVELAPELPELRRALGQAWFEVAAGQVAAGDLDAARAALDRAIEVAPELGAAATADPRLAPLAD